MKVMKDPLLIFLEELVGILNVKVAGGDEFHFVTKQIKDLLKRAGFDFSNPDASEFATQLAKHRVEDAEDRGYTKGMWRD